MGQWRRVVGEHEEAQRQGGLTENRCDGCRRVPGARARETPPAVECSRFEVRDRYTAFTIRFEI